MNAQGQAHDPGDEGSVPGALGIDFSTSSTPIGRQHDRLEIYAFHKEPKASNRRCFEIRMLLFLMVSWVKITFHFATLANCVVGIGAWAAFYFTFTPSDLPLNLFTFGIIFPLSFLIQYSLGRRENTLREIAAVKSAALLLFWGCRDFPPQNPSHAEALKHLRESLTVLLLTARQTMLHKEHSSSLYAALNNVQTRLTAMLAECPPAFRLSGIYARIHQLFQALVDSTERMLVIHHYRSPAALRGYSMVFLFLNSLIFAPIFARYSLNPMFGTWAGVYCSVVVSVIYSGLYRILVAEEDPFSGHGIDVMTLDPLTRHAKTFEI